MKRILALLLVSVMLLASLAACNGDSSGNNGTTSPPEVEVDPNSSVYGGTPDTSWYTGDKSEYILTTAAQLYGFQELRSSTCTFEGVTIKLGADIVLNPGSIEEIKAAATKHEWRILTPDQPFRGTFDGQGHTVSGLYLQLKDTGVASMFGVAAGNATITNFKLVNSYFGGPNAADQTTLAAIVSQITEDDANVTISFVSVHAEITETSKPFSKAAGFVGYISGAGTLSMTNCEFDGLIKVSGTHVGGLVAHIDSAKAVINIGSCSNFGDLTASRYCGGIIGQTKSQSQKVNDCISRGELTCDLDSGRLYGEKIDLYDPNEGARPETPEGKTALRVMSFNVQGSLSTSGGSLTDAALNRVEAVKQEILAHNPDLLGLQEDREAWLIHLNLEDYNIIQYSSGLSAGAERCAIYYKKGLTLLESGMKYLTPESRYGEGSALTMEDITTQGSRYYLTPEELEILDIHPAEGDASIYGKKYQYVDKDSGEVKPYTAGYTYTTLRKMTYGVFDIKGQTVIYINTHLNHRAQNSEYSNPTYLKIRSFERVKEFYYMQQTLAELLKKYPNSPVFMTGDWNDGIDSEIYTVVTKEAGFRSSHTCTDDVIGYFGTWNNAFDLDVQGDCYPSSKEGPSGGYLDYCFISPEIDVLRFIYGEGKAKITAVDGTRKFIYTSDHRPIIADICFDTPRTGSPIDPNYKEPTEDFSKPSTYSGIPDTAWYTGDKTEYTLINADQFVGMLLLRQNSSGSLTFEGVTIKLARDLIFNEGTVAEFLKVGNPTEIQALNSNYQFKGTFDGQGHTIHGIYMQCTSAAVKGLFGGLGDNAVIKNLTLEECYAGGASSSGKNTLAILAARISGTNVLFSNIKIVNAQIQEGTATMYAYGALAGRLDTSASLTIENCEVSGTINAPNCSKIGSLVGYAFTGSSLTIKNSSSSMSITAKNEAGGLVGYISDNVTLTVTNGTFTGSITCPGSKGDICSNWNP